MTQKVSKACEPCRGRKIRCSGSVPCQRRECKADPQVCVYRLKARNRQSQKQKRLLGDAVASPSPPISLGPSVQPQPRDNNDKEAEHETQPEVHHSVTESHLSPKPTDSSQLFYGPSSNFAFVQQVHRAIVSTSHNGQAQSHDGVSGLDTFMMRSIFFGTPSRIDPEAIRSPSVSLEVVHKSQAREYLEAFKTTSHYRLPFYTVAELDSLFETLYDPRLSQAIAPQTKAAFLAILAIGALATPHTNVAETLMMQAKREAIVLDDTVSLRMVQLSILFADYQINLGRPNSTYLHLGVACRKAFALGLNNEVFATRQDEATVDKHRTTLWLLYFYETCQSLTLGRRSSLKFADITCSFPAQPSAVAKLASIARIMEDTFDSMYGKRAENIRQLFTTAERLYSELNRFAETHNIAFATRGKFAQDAPCDFESLTFHNLYYHTVLLIFRPFLVAAYALQTSRQTKHITQMWLRQACRHAVDAAQDFIIYASNTILNSPLAGTLRYQAFFIECCCAILFYDMLCEPTKYSYHSEYIKKAVQTMQSMVQDEPVTTCINSIRRIQEVIKLSISRQLQIEVPPTQTQAPYPVHIHADSLVPQIGATGGAGTEQMIFLTNGAADITDENCGPLAAELDALTDQDWLNPNHFNLNVMTTDLFNYFPMDSSTPSTGQPSAHDYANL